MDISKEYIKMCDCPEIQKAYKNRKCDILNSFYHYIEDPEDHHIITEEVWLPRQDQIQEMMNREGCKFEFTHYTNKICGHFTNKERHLFGLHCDSMEQLWLAFYRFKNHQKIWDGDKWIKSETE